MSDEEWSRVREITLNVIMRIMGAMMRGMILRKCGGIVNNASVPGWRVQPE